MKSVWKVLHGFAIYKLNNWWKLQWFDFGKLWVKFCKVEAQYLAMALFLMQKWEQMQEWSLWFVCCRWWPIIQMVVSGNVVTIAHPKRQFQWETHENPVGFGLFPTFSRQSRMIKITWSIWTQPAGPGHRLDRTGRRINLMAQVPPLKFEADHIGTLRYHALHFETNPTISCEWILSIYYIVSVYIYI